MPPKQQLQQGHLTTWTLRPSGSQRRQLVACWTAWQPWEVGMGTLGWRCGGELMTWWMPL